MSKKPSRKTLKNKCDKLWAELVKQRDNYTCQKCGATRENGMIDACHINSRRNTSTRWVLENGITLCRRDHYTWAHIKPLEFAEFIKKRLGIERYEALIRRANTIVKLDYGEVLKELNNDS